MLIVKKTLGAHTRGFMYLLHLCLGAEYVVHLSHA